MVRISIIGLSIAIAFTSCKNQKADTNEEVQAIAEVDTIHSYADTISHGYNELANSANLEAFSISDYNTDNPNTPNIDRPSISTIKTNLDTSLLFQIWVQDTSDPHATFVFSNQSFYVVDYGGNGDMPYELTNNKLKIYYNDFIQEGEIISVDKDTLKIKWQEFDDNTSYVRWRF